MRKWIVFASIMLFHAATQGQEEKPKALSLKGYVKFLQMTSFLDNPESMHTLNMIHNRVNARWNISGSLYTRVEIRNKVYYGEQLKLLPGFSSSLDSDEDFLDLSKLWVDEKTLVIHSTFDRALLNYSGAKYNFSIGRQRVNWGINTVWNPNDIFNAYNFLDFDYEERPGVDAFRFQYYVNTKSGFEIAVKPSKKTGESIQALLFKTNKWKYDVQLLAANHRQDIVVGTGWAGNIEDAGFKGEISWFFDKHNLSKPGSFVSSVTVDYTFKNSWYVTVSALYQSKVEAAFLSNTVYSNSNLSPKNLMPYHKTFYASVSKQFTPLWMAGFTTVYSPEKNSTILFPNVTWSVAENFDIDLTMQSFLADELNVYRTAGNFIYLRVKASF